MNSTQEPPTEDLLGGSCVPRTPFSYAFLRGLIKSEEGDSRDQRLQPIRKIEQLQLTGLLTAIKRIAHDHLPQV